MALSLKAHQDLTSFLRVIGSVAYIQSHLPDIHNDQWLIVDGIPGWEYMKIHLREQVGGMEVPKESEVLVYNRHLYFCHEDGLQTDCSTLVVWGALIGEDDTPSIFSWWTTELMEIKNKAFPDGVSMY